MNPVKAALLSLAMLSALAVSGVGIYAAASASDFPAIDGYGISAAAR